MGYPEKKPYNGGRQEPHDNRSGQGNNISYTPCEIAQKEKISNDPKGQREAVEDEFPNLSAKTSTIQMSGHNIPLWIWNRDSIIICPFWQLAIIREINLPLGDEASNRQ